jgi:hypothetical protein
LFGFSVARKLPVLVWSDDLTTAILRHAKAVRATHRECASAWTSHLGCSSTSEEVQEEHHYTDDQQDVNETCGNVKGQEPKQPKNN